MAKSGNPNEFILPDLGEGVHEAELKEWRVKVGDTVEEHEILAEMETDKALVEVPSPRAGTIAKLHGEAGEILHVGNPLVTYEGGAGEGGAGEGGAGEDKQAKKSGPASGEPSKGASEMAPEAKPAKGGDDDRGEDSGTVVGQMSAGVAGMTASSGKALATPAVRRLARDMGIDINAVPGTGIGGRVTEKDVRAAATGDRAAPSAPPSQAPSPRSEQPAMSFSGPALTSEIPALSAVQIPPGEATARIPFRGVRRTVANRMRQSLDNAAHFYVMDEADVTALDGLRKRLAAASGEKVSFLPFVAGAVCRVLTDERFRGMNAVVDDEKEEIVQHRAVHMGFAVDTDAGLMVPVVRDCDAYGVLQINRAVGQVSAAARNRSIPRDDLIGSTFTISNVGSHAGRFATPIINYPEVGILAVGRARDAMVVKDSWFRMGKLLPLSLACDHRVVDGATAALALAEIIRLLQDPENLLEPARQ